MYSMTTALLSFIFQVPSGVQQQPLPHLQVIEQIQVAADDGGCSCYGYVGFESTIRYQAKVVALVRIKSHQVLPDYVGKVDHPEHYGYAEAEVIEYLRGAPTDTLAHKIYILGGDGASCTPPAGSLVVGGMFVVALNKASEEDGVAHPYAYTYYLSGECSTAHLSYSPNNRNVTGYIKSVPFKKAPMGWETFTRKKMSYKKLKRKVRNKWKFVSK
jgi:hypothetical protein